MKPLNRYFDHTNLKPTASEADIIRLCTEAKKYDFYAVCVHGCHVPLAVKELESSGVRVAAAAGFPLGMNSSEAKKAEIESLCRQGAQEVDMVINVAALKEGRCDYVKGEIMQAARTAADHKAIVKVILETCLLTDEEIETACRLAIEAGAAFVKTSTGFSTGGATPHAMSLIKRTVGDKILIKASGGIRDILTAREMLRLGADRIGASASVAIMEALK